MKPQHTADRKDSFSEWRIGQIDKFGRFLWPQINYDFETADVISAIFEQQGQLNSAIPSTLENAKIKNHIINFTNPGSEYYVSPQNLAKALNLRLATQLPPNWNGCTYWHYRLATRPQNCLTADVDALEVKKSGDFVAVEAAQLYDTSSIDIAIRHIFRTFKFRPNQVNPKQYLAQHKYAKAIGGESFILFHQIIQGKTDTNSPVFTIRNDGRFFEMLSKIISQYSKQDEAFFVRDYSGYLRSALKQHKNIDIAYRWLLN